MKTDRLDLRNCDCMELMAEFPDNHFDLAIVDPPYGIGFGAYERYGYKGKEHLAGRYKADKKWDEATPPPEYFEELRRVSKDQIVWGGNYFPELWSTGCRGFIFWHKGNPVENFSDGELAWTSIDSVARCFKYSYYGNIAGNTSAMAKIHPTQKPVSLYRWLLDRYAKPGQRILDTHLGSGSIAIACHYFGAHLTGSELDPDYFAAACERIERETAQEEMFAPEPVETAPQPASFLFDE